MREVNVLLDIYREHLDNPLQVENEGIGIDRELLTESQHRNIQAVQAYLRSTNWVPTFDDWARWPHLVVGTPGATPRPEWGWGTAHIVAAVALWTFLGLSLHRRYDLGSRTALK